ncbi:uncharacterized protein LOC110020068 [Phalaenopsis equestris]|uniref:uncharacterized protein LOC110020068 n=1 Tax=Phalaenopsis equestris TaxID=78828 RepID=UPI0009E5F344|nr:uncharacterized protein LOC110020068 [Phalaenopsis equestris]
MELQSSSATFASFSRSLLNLHRDLDDLQQEPAGWIQEQGIDAFQLHVAELFAELSAAGGDDLLSLTWIRKLLDAFLFCQEEFRFILFNNRHLLSRSPMDRLISDFYDRGVKALDLCNAIRDGIEQVRQWEKLMEIVLIALDPRQSFISQGQIRRSEKALIDLAFFIHDEKESSSVTVQRNRSFSLQQRAAGHYRSYSWSVSRSWSAAKQLQAIGNNIYFPRSHEVVATSGLANSVFTMNSLLHFVMWVLVAAIPCQDRGLQAHFSILKSFPWGASVISLHERIMEESKKRERKKSVGLLKEIHQLEKCTLRLLQLTESVEQFPEREEEEMIRQAVLGFGHVYNSMKDDLDLLERQIRHVFHEIVHSRIDGLDCLHKPK